MPAADGKELGEFGGHVVGVDETVNSEKLAKNVDETGRPEVPKSEVATSSGFPSFWSLVVQAWSLDSSHN